METRNIHCRIPYKLWRKLRTNFPEKGDMNRVVNLALELYLDVWERKTSRR